MEDLDSVPKEANNHRTLQVQLALAMELENLADLLEKKEKLTKQKAMNEVQKLVDEQPYGTIHAICAESC